MSPILPAPIPVVASSRRVPVQAVNQLNAVSDPYTIKWDGKSGQLITTNDKGKSETLPLVYLHSDVGPAGFARHLAWFIARSESGFRILWCYLNDTGSEFDVWLYSYPENRLTTHHFKGNYRFTPPTTAPEAPMDLLLKPAPAYAGPDFAFGDWTRQTGTVAPLELKDSAIQAKQGDPTPGAAISITGQLKATPLHEVRVGQANGWKDQGWQELHSLAYDTNSRPFYLIQYSQTTKGYVLDVAAAKLYTTDFKNPVKFGSPTTAFSAGTPTTPGSLTLHSRRFDVLEIPFVGSKLDNPYTEASVVATLTSPDGVDYVVPGFWKGETQWVLRFTPTRVGNWTYKIQSSLPDIDGKTGQFDCMPDEQSIKGHMQVGTSATVPRRFVTSDGAPVFPVYAQANYLNSTPDEQAALKAKDGDASLALFSKRMENLARQGVNRITGDLLLPSKEVGLFARNEGGSIFEDNDPDKINLKYFDWLDRRIEILGKLNITPDFSLGDPGQGVFSRVPRPALQRLWQTILARYAAYPVAYSVFASDTLIAPENPYSVISSFGQATRTMDWLAHPITTVASVITETRKPDTTTVRNSKKKPQGEFYESEKPKAVTRFGDMKWLNYITQAPGTKSSIWANLATDKPVVLQGDPKLDDIGRLREMWETYMSGASWISPERFDNPNAALPLSETAAINLLKSTKYWKLESHQELLTTEKRNRNSFQSPLDRPVIPSPLVVSDPAWEYILYFKGGETATLDLLEATGDIKTTWLEVKTGKMLMMEMIEGGRRVNFTPPTAEDWVLYITRRI